MQDGIRLIFHLFNKCTSNAQCVLRIFLEQQGGS